MDQQQFCLRWNNHGSTLVAVFDNLLASESLVDVTLFAEGHRLKAHKVVLSACSPYFQQVFAETQDRHPIVVLKDVGHVVLRALLEYMYRGEVNVAQDQLETLIRTAESLKIKGLADGTRGTPGLAPRGDTEPPSSPTSVPVTQVSSQGAPQGEACPGGIKEQRTPLGESRIAPRGERNDNYQLPQSSASSIPSVLSTVLTMPPALSLAAAAANAPLPTKIKLERPPPTAPQDAPPGSPLAKRRRKSPVPSYLKVRHCSGGRESAVDRDSGADSDGRSSSSPGDTLTHLPRIPATITPVAPLHYPLERPETAPSGTPGSSSPSPDSVGTRSDVQPSSPVPRPVSSLGHSSPPLFKARGRLDENSSDANHHSDDDGETLRQVKDHGDTAGPSTSRLSHDDGPHTPSYLGWPYPQDPPSSSEDPPSFPSLENTNQGYHHHHHLDHHHHNPTATTTTTTTPTLSAPPAPPTTPLAFLTQALTRQLINNLARTDFPAPQTENAHKTAHDGLGNVHMVVKDTYMAGGDVQVPTGTGTHAQTHTRTHKCPQCGKAYLVRRSLHRHLKFECGVEPQFTCPVCTKRCTHKFNLKQHILSHHKLPMS